VTRSIRDKRYRFRLDGGTSETCRRRAARLLRALPYPPAGHLHRRDAPFVVGRFVALVMESPVTVVSLCRTIRTSSSSHVIVKASLVPVVFMSEVLQLASSTIARASVCETTLDVLGRDALQLLLFLKPGAVKHRLRRFGGNVAKVHLECQLVLPSPIPHNGFRTFHGNAG
jgi:hypothetical protein